MDEGKPDEVFIGVSKAAQRIRDKLRTCATKRSTVLLTGPTGVGKEAAAQAIRAYRLDRCPFVAINCMAVPPNLIAAELFGSVEGAYTDAKNRDGAFKRASGGVLFLDEIGELDTATQVNLLRAIQEREILPLGSGAVIKVDVQLITATNRDLEAEVTAGRFRADLFHRINVIPIAIPPLRDRLEDIGPLFLAFLRREPKAPAGMTFTLATAALERLRAHDWRGNSRELQNCAMRVLFELPETGHAAGHDVSLAEVETAIGGTASDDAEAQRRDAGRWVHQVRSSCSALRSSEVLVAELIHRRSRAGLPWPTAKVRDELAEVNHHLQQRFEFERSNVEELTELLERYYVPLADKKARLRESVHDFLELMASKPRTFGGPDDHLYREDHVMKLVGLCRSEKKNVVVVDVLSREGKGVYHELEALLEKAKEDKIRDLVGRVLFYERPPDKLVAWVMSKAFQDDLRERDLRLMFKLYPDRVPRPVDGVPTLHGNLVARTRAPDDAGARAELIDLLRACGPEPKLGDVYLYFGVSPRRGDTDAYVFADLNRVSKSLDGYKVIAKTLRAFFNSAWNDAGPPMVESPQPIAAAG